MLSILLLQFRPYIFQHFLNMLNTQEMAKYVLLFLLLPRDMAIASSLKMKISLY